MGKIGRPPKERFEYTGVILTPLDQNAICALHAAIGALDCVSALPARYRVSLLRAMTSVVEDFRLISKLAKHRRSGRGNKPKADISLLLFRCAEVWASATKVRAVSLWERDDRSKESPPVQIARACLEFVLGKAHPFSLRQQISRAPNWKRLPKRREGVSVELHAMTPAEPS